MEIILGSAGVFISSVEFSQDSFFVLFIEKGIGSFIEFLDTVH
jgi:hypothetical protein